LAQHRKRDGSSHDIHKKKWDSLPMRFVIRICIALLATALALPASSAENIQIVDCSNITTSYNQALTAFTALTAPTQDDFRNLKKERKLAERKYRICLKSINREFKVELKKIKELYPRIEGQRELNLSNKAEKDKAIASAIINRDIKIQALPVVPSLPSFQN
jgi:Skp family chaperone for outer membrane proteins